MKQLLFISIMCALMCASSSVSQANGSQPKAGIENIGCSPGTIHLPVAIFDNKICSFENNYTTGSPAQTRFACDKAITAPADKGYASPVDRNLSKRDKYLVYNSDNKKANWLGSKEPINLKNIKRCNGYRSPRDGFSC